MRILSRFKKKDPISETAVMRWREMYIGQKGDGYSLNLAAAISAELARLSTIEMRTTLSGGKSKNMIQPAIDALTNDMRYNVELCCALGGGIFRPYYDGKNLKIEFFPADRFEITSFTADGTPDGCILRDTIKIGDRFFTKLEEHGFSEEGYIITNRAFKGLSDNGAEISLSEISKWQHLSKKCVITNLKAPLFVYLRMPSPDNKAPSRRLGASVFARAEGLIKQADKQFERLIWEFEGGELAIDASVDALRFNEKGTFELPKLNKRLFRGLGIDAGDKDLYSVFSPQLRDKSIINGLNEILMRIEDCCGLARGTFSNAPETAKTATEIKILNQRSYATVCDIQREIRLTLEKLCVTLEELCALYGLPHGGKTQISIEFDDSIVTDRSTEFDEKLRLVQAEIMSKDEFREWYFGYHKDIPMLYK